MCHVRHISCTCSAIVILCELNTYCDEMQFAVCSLYLLYYGNWIKEIHVKISKKKKKCQHFMWIPSCPWKLFKKFASRLISISWLNLITAFIVNSARLIKWNCTSMLSCVCIIAPSTMFKSLKTICSAKILRIRCKTLQSTACLSCLMCIPL